MASAPATFRVESDAWRGLSCAWDFDLARLWRLYQAPTLASTKIARMATTKPDDAALSVGQDNEGCQQGSHGGAGISADLKQRLRHAVLAARRHAGHARRLRMEHRGTHAHQRHRHQDHRETGSHRQ